MVNWNQLRICIFKESFCAFKIVNCVVGLKIICDFNIK